MNNKKTLFLIHLSLCLLNLSNIYPITILHEFGEISDAGRSPQGGLTLSGNTFYGMTDEGGRQIGGQNSLGVLFSIGMDGSNYTVLHNFTGGIYNGKHPWRDVIISNNVIYGMTEYGGEKDKGVIFSINIDGSNFTLLHTFTGWLNDGSNPKSSLLLSDNKLYGVTRNGGNSHYGVIFSINTNGDNYTILHEFEGGVNDGRNPYCDLIFYNNKLYGTTANGGDSNWGTIFSINPNGSNFTLLYEFAGGVNDGREPYGSLIISGNTFYGMTDAGGVNDMGTIFSIDTDGTNYTILHEFTGGGNDGKWPKGTLTQYGNTLYGMTTQGGDSDWGIVFSINKNGSNFNILHEFAGGDNDGANASWGRLVISGISLYGMTQWGGDKGHGVIFSIEDQSLPVTLTSFNANQENSKVVLRWATESEIDNQGFILERRETNKTEWIKIADFNSHPELKGQGTVSFRTEYRFIDHFVKVGVSYEYRLSDMDINGRISYLKTISIVFKKQGGVSPSEFALYQAYPNPFNSIITIPFDLPEMTKVRLLIVNSLGNEVKVITSGTYEVGHHEIKFEASNLSSGVYFYKLKAGKFFDIKKIALVK